jgi:archaellum component FlaC
MGMPALKFEWETPVEERIARLETNYEHIRTDLTEVKTDLRRLNDKMDAGFASVNERFEGIHAKFDAKFDGVDKKFEAVYARFDGVDKKFEGVYARFDSIKDAIADLRVSHAMDRVWWLLMSAAMLGIMARGFKWI